MSLPTMTAAWARPLQPPAYNAVTPRTTLQATPALVGSYPPVPVRPALNGGLQPNLGPVASKPKKVEWPPAVRDYVRRAFDPANAIAGINNADMQTKLKATI